MRKKDVLKVEQVEEYYNQARKIKFADDITIRNVKQIKRFLFNNEDYFPSTVYTKGGKHCIEGKYRSFDDYFLLCKYYFPKLTIKYFCQVLIKDEEFQAKKNGMNIYARYCPDIRKTNSGGLYPSSWEHYSHSRIHENPRMGVKLGFPRVFSFEDLINV